MLLEHLEGLLEAIDLQNNVFGLLENALHVVLYGDKCLYILDVLILCLCSLGGLQNERVELLKA
jgi:hypothetical protein